MQNFIIASPAKIKVVDSQIVFVSESGTHRFNPEKVGSILVTNNGASITSHAISLLSKMGIVLIFCDERNLPVSELLPFSTHSRLAEISYQQIESFYNSKKLLKQLWESILLCKINNQKEVLDALGKNSNFINRYINSPILNEGVVAQLYFRELFGPDFKREDEDNRLNYYLDFSYGLIRSRISFEIAARGMLPHLGIGHKSTLNRLNLIYDLIEPYRPIIDYYIVQNINSLGKAYSKKDFTVEKKILLEVFNLNVLEFGQQQQITVNITNFVRDFRRILVYRDSVSLSTLPSIGRCIIDDF